MKRVYRDCSIFINQKGTMAYFIEIDMVDFYVTLGMDWLRAYYASMDLHTNRVKKTKKFSLQK